MLQVTSGDDGSSGSGSSDGIPESEPEVEVHNPKKEYEWKSDDEEKPHRLYVPYTMHKPAR